MKISILRTVALVLISLQSIASGDEHQDFRYGPKYLEYYKISSGVISNAKLPTWIEGQWWARYYSAGSNPNLKNTPRRSNQSMGRPFEFYGWLVRVPEGDHGHTDYKVVKATQLRGAGALVLNLVLIEKPSKGAVLVINRDSPNGASSEHLVIRWRHGFRVEERALFASPLSGKSILSDERLRMDYLHKKYVASEDPEAFDYKAWHSSAVRSNKRGETNP